MGKQKNIRITGTVGNLTFYESGGKYYVRLKSSLSGDRVRKDPAFKRTMANAAIFGQAARISAEVYRLLPEKKKKNGMHQVITARAIRLLRDEKLEPEELKEQLIHEFLPGEN